MFVTNKGIVKTIYDPACGTGGMLSVAGDYLRDLNPGARLEVFGQEVNPESYAICKSNMLEAIIAMPDQLFYNTGIFTYIWILTNRKPAERKGKIQLVNAVTFFEKMSRSLGNKRNEINMTKYFYKYRPLRSLEEIRTDILELELQTKGLMSEVVEI